MTYYTRELVVTVLSLLLTLLGACPVTGCSGIQRDPAVTQADAAAFRDVGPGASVHTFNLDGAATAAIAGVTAVVAAVGAYALWKHNPAIPQLKGTSP